MSGSGTGTKVSASGEPITLTEAKLHLRLAVDAAGAVAYTEEDDLLNVLIQVAREQVEAITWRAMITQNKTLYLDAWPTKSFIKLPYAPLQSVTGIYYTEEDALVESTFTDYTVDTHVEPGRIVLNAGASWPSEALEMASPIRIPYVAGYGAAADVPASIQAAMKLILTDLYENRGEVVVGAPVDRIKAVSSLLASYRCFTEL